MKPLFSFRGSCVAGLSLLCLTWPELPLADAPQRYGSFRYDGAVPHTLFLTGEIAQGDSFELRRALRDHPIRLVVPASPGGNLYEGLQMASILHDKGIGTYVPPSAACESSCANIYFGGAKRLVRGKLGVHQFYFKGPEPSATQRRAETTTTVQYTTSDIIGIMNEFQTPPFVYEKMFGTDDIYYFSEAEKPALARGAEDPAFQEDIALADAFLRDRPDMLRRPGRSTPPAPVTAQSSDPKTRYQDVDFFGMDLTEAGIRDISLKACDALCRSMPHCAAYSYVTQSGWCWPKSGVENLTIADGTVSGIVDFARITPGLFDRPFVEATGVDLPGNDLFARGLKHHTLAQCRTACLEIGACTGFTWLAAKNWCFPKFGAPEVVATPGALSGILK